MIACKNVGMKSRMCQSVVVFGFTRLRWFVNGNGQFPYYGLSCQRHL
jgi:hypothetical protein